MSVVSIMGAGHMGQAIGSLVNRGGNTVDQLDRQSTDIRGDLVILAIPYLALAEVANKYSTQLAGKIVVDISNPLDFSTFDRLLVPPESSAAEELAARLPDSSILKAFNTTFAATVANGTTGTTKTTTTVLIAGDDPVAKDRLTQVVSEGGLHAFDAGSLKRAHELEAIGFEQLVLASNERIPWTGGFAVLD